MIRCIPVDGSEAFEVENDAMAYDCAQTVAAIASGEGRNPRDVVRADRHIVFCRIESWRERAERLEKELAELRRKIVLDAIDARREYEHP